MLDSLFKKLRESGNLEHHYTLKDKSVFDGVQRGSFCNRAGIDKAPLHYVLREDACHRKNAVKIAAALEMPFDKVFADVTQKPGLSGA
jgi:hypothetical protein